MRYIAFAVLVVALSSAVGATAEPQSLAQSSCGETLRTALAGEVSAEAHIGALLFCLRFQRPAGTAEFDALLPAYGFEKTGSGPRGSLWRKDGAGWVLRLAVVIERGGVGSQITLEPSTPLTVAEPMLKHLLASATDIERLGREVILNVQVPDDLYEGCQETTGYKLSLDGKLITTRHSYRCSTQP